VKVSYSCAKETREVIRGFRVPVSLDAPWLTLDLREYGYYPVPAGQFATSVNTPLGVFPQMNSRIRPGDIIMFFDWDGRDDNDRFLRVTKGDLRSDRASMLLPTGLVIPEPRNYRRPKSLN
jgi:hypothetical protein